MLHRQVGLMICFGVSIGSERLVELVILFRHSISRHLKAVDYESIGQEIYSSRATRVHPPRVECMERHGIHVLGLASPFARSETDSTCEEAVKIEVF